jgi:hypothetical protein
LLAPLNKLVFLDALWFSLQPRFYVFCHSSSDVPFYMLILASSLVCSPASMSDLLLRGLGNAIFDLGYALLTISA